ncbi:hypothetical protein GCK72_022673 [Caenorhabditis remanei]|uniref:BTB domain-containing protein n=1 Tax=Caenorhabditis remanei TaxID=31234 RepID=A0A6A5FUB3_CAERE|nr:hypothetical protein GCK72_022673 [Caenorhabditis remanei]KAF1746220.1 hypothetical protein GCK72_022673 [Caenorhabditis remanei]
MVSGRKRPSRFDYPLDARPGAGPSHRPILAQDSDIEEGAFYKTTPPAYICYVDFTSNADPNLSDLVLVADGRRFYVDKRNLARHSTMLNAMFFGRFEESRRDEIKVGDVAEKSLQRFLDLTVGVHKVLTDENVEKVLVLADYWDAQIVKKICEESKTMGIPKKLEAPRTLQTSSAPRHPHHPKNRQYDKNGISDLKGHNSYNERAVIECSNACECSWRCQLQRGQPMSLLVFLFGCDTRIWNEDSGNSRKKNIFVNTLER